MAFAQHYPAEHAVDAALLSGAREAERVLRKFGAVELFTMARRAKGGPLVYWLGDIPKNVSIGPLREALRHLFYRNEASLYFLAKTGYLLNDKQGVASEGGTDRSEVVFCIASDGREVRNAYSRVHRDDTGKVTRVGVLHAVDSTKQGPFHGLLNPTGAFSLDGPSYAVAEQLEVNRLLYEALPARGG